jgi:hypothetical protein
MTEDRRQRSEDRGLRADDSVRRRSRTESRFGVEEFKN